MCVCVCARARACVRECVRACVSVCLSPSLTHTLTRAHTHTHTHTTHTAHTHTHTHTHTHSTHTHTHTHTIQSNLLCSALIRCGWHYVCRTLTPDPGRGEGRRGAARVVFLQPSGPTTPVSAPRPPPQKEVREEKTAPPEPHQNPLSDVFSLSSESRERFKDNLTVEQTSQPTGRCAILVFFVLIPLLL